MQPNYPLFRPAGFILAIILAALVSPNAQAKPAPQINEWSGNDSHLSSPVVSTHLLTNSSQNALAPQIEIAPLSGVSGYSIGIFGSGFGNTQGTLSILGQAASVSEWTSTFIAAEVPSTSAGTGQLEITTADAQTISQPFQIYTINPTFQRAPRNRFVNIMRGKSAIAQNVEGGFCYTQPNGVDTEPTDFLTDFGCGFSGIIGDGEVVASIPNGGSTAISVDLEQNLAGTYYFQFFSYSGWYANWDIYPKDYQIQVSADSTNGVDGSWQTVHTQTNNVRGSRLHKIEVPDQGHHWVRMSITSGSNEPRIKLKEIRLYQSSNGEVSDLDIMTLYGDSITEGAFYHIGATGFSLDVSNKINSADEIIFVSFGLSGQNATGLIEQDNVDFDIYDAFATDDMSSMARYWGIALGNNDLGPSSDINVPGTLMAEFSERLETMVQFMISQGKVPIVARIPDIDETSPDLIISKKKILDDIDRIAAQYRLMPGPDLYTLMRLNIERDNASWYWPGDPYHQNWTGRLKIIDAWSSAFIQGTNRAAYSIGDQPTPTPIAPTNTPVPTMTNTPIPTATSTPLPTATNTPLPTATENIEPTATSTPLPTNNPLPTATAQPTAASTATSTALPTTLAETATPVGTAPPQQTDSPESTATSVPTQGNLATAQPSVQPTAQPTSIAPDGQTKDNSTYLPIVGQ